MIRLSIAVALVAACSDDSSPTTPPDTDAGPSSRDGGSCIAATCESASFECGEQLDGCGGTLACGACEGALVCDRGACTDPGTIEHERADNPFEGASFYVSPLYAANVESSAATAPAALREAVASLASQPTAVWLDRIAAIDPAEGMGLADHLDEALRQQAASEDPSAPMLATFVIYDLPDRDCAALASNGELKSAEDGVRRYREEYIDRIVEVLTSNPVYERLRIVAVVEPDSLPNLVTNVDVIPACRAAEPIYRESVAYAISRLGALEHVYVYLDIAHSGWLGWEHPATAATLYREVIAAAGGDDLVAGFATNVSNYTPLREPFNPFDDVGANMSLIVDFYEWNRVIDETRFVEAMRAHFPSHGFIVDTGRNGWRPRGERQPLDARVHRGNWCNQAGGIGERPRANPAAGIDAYFWIKPPGESDGTSDETATEPNEEGKRFDPMCGTAPVERVHAPGRAIPTGALDGAPHAGHWFAEHLIRLVENATPPLP
jgi:cellulose 1,4-beta-cellobiosidase